MKGFLVIAIVGIAAISLLSYSSSSENENQFRTFLDTYRVGYGTTDEYNYRFEVFKANLKTIEEMRLLNPLATFGVNQFADRTQKEIKYLMGFESNSNTQSKSNFSTLLRARTFNK